MYTLFYQPKTGTWIFCWLIYYICHCLSTFHYQYVSLYMRLYAVVDDVRAVSRFITTIYMEKKVLKSIISPRLKRMYLQVRETEWSNRWLVGRLENGIASDVQLWWEMLFVLDSMFLAYITWIYDQRPKGDKQKSCICVTVFNINSWTGKWELKLHIYILAYLVTFEDLILKQI